MRRGAVRLLLGGIILGCVPSCRASAPAAPAGDHITVKVLVLSYDPRAGGRPLHEFLEWQDPRRLAALYADDVSKASGGSVQFAIVEWRDLEAFPAKVDGFRYTVQQYVHNHRRGTGWHDPDTVDYRQTFDEQRVQEQIDGGRVDEVWLFGGPYFGYSESAMAGPGAFYINGEVLTDVAVRRPFAVMGFNYERGVAEMLENLCHRTEATMSRAYGGWRAEAPNHNWARFAASERQSGTAGAGSCHWPPNAEREYDWENPRFVMSTADLWRQYPNLDGPRKPVNRDSWGGPDYARNYFRWWFERLPRSAGVNVDGRLNNWWKYVFEFNRLDER